MKIQKIEAENFKLFTSNFDKIQDIADSDMILFNGPNGYGKTSVFDIIEFCLTGDIKRISDYSDELAIAKNERFENKILIADESKKSFVKLVLRMIIKKLKYVIVIVHPKREKVFQKKIILIIFLIVLQEQSNVMEKQLKMKRNILRVYSYMI